MNFPYPTEKTACHLWLQVLEQSSAIQAADADNASSWVRTQALALRMIGAVGLVLACAIDLSIWTLRTVTIFRVYTHGLSHHFMDLVKTIVSLAYVIILPFHLVRRPLHITDSVLIDAPPSEQRSRMRKTVLNKMMEATPVGRQAWCSQVTAKLQREALERGTPFDSLICRLIANQWYSFASKIIENPADFGMTIADLGTITRGRHAVVNQIFIIEHDPQILRREDAADLSPMALALISNDNIPFSFKSILCDEDPTISWCSDFHRAIEDPLFGPLITDLLEKATRLGIRISEEELSRQLVPELPPCAQESS